VGSDNGDQSGGRMVVTAIVITGFPALRPNAVEAGTRYIELGITWKALRWHLSAARSSR
jgi:hypothetical protein